MADKKQPRLNGAYYGPSIPPTAAEQPHHRPHRGRGKRCCCCLFGILWKLLVAIIVFVVLAFLVYWILVQPRSFKFYVTEAKLTQFDYAGNNSTLRYNLVLNFTARNPNKKLSIYYDEVEGHAFYQGYRFDTADVITYLNSFRQYTKSTDRMSGVFSGQQVFVLDQDQVSEYREEKRAGAFDIYVKLYFKIRFRLGDLIGGATKVKAKCELRVPLSSKDGRPAAAFYSIKCDVDF